MSVSHTLRHALPGERCLVLGGSGFLGSHLVELLLKEGIHVRVYSRSANSYNRLASLEDKIELVGGDIRASKALARAVEGCDYVFHLIGTTVPATSNLDPVFDIETNLSPAMRLLEVCVGAKVKQLIFASSGGTVYGDAGSEPIPETHPAQPRSSYGITKLTIESYLNLFYRLHGLDYAILRIANVYGPRLPTRGQQNAVGAFLARLSRGEPIVVWGDGSVTRDYVYVEDVARAFRAVLGQQSIFKVFNIGTGVGTTLLELVARMEQVVGRRAEIVRQPGRQIDIPINILDPTRAREHLGWQAATSLEAGLASTWSWMQAQDLRFRVSGAP
jgi:UDP-glucose 4-epimerase